MDLSKSTGTLPGNTVQCVCGMAFEVPHGYRMRVTRQPLWPGSTVFKYASCISHTIEPVDWSPSSGSFTWS